ncbi:MAG: sporulation transcriptional regulator SpoIIID [Nostocaceae cyanobacterium]|nr:sporulation transcriptional regulator SpoIIID [Nostocaceae cyanobacterium]
MSLTIRERCRKVAEYVNNKGQATIESIAKVTGLSKSSVHRHKQALIARNQYSESEFWETNTGSEWLKLMVIGVVYYFGVKEGIGCERLAEFLSAIRLGEHVGISPSAIRS